MSTFEQALKLREQRLAEIARKRQEDRESDERFKMAVNAIPERLARLRDADAQFDEYMRRAPKIRIGGSDHTYGGQKGTGIELVSFSDLVPVYDHFNRCATQGLMYSSLVIFNDGTKESVQICVKKDDSVMGPYWAINSGHHPSKANDVLNRMISGDVELITVLFECRPPAPTSVAT